MKKLGTVIMCALIAVLTVISVIPASAASSGLTTVYLEDNGKGDGSTPEKAAGDLFTAYDSLDLSKDCTIVICGVFTQEWLFSLGSDYTGSVTFTSVYGGVDYRTGGAVYKFEPCRFVCFGDTAFENMNFEALSTNILVIGQHHHVTIGEGVSMTGDKMTGGSVAKAFCILGGYQKDQDEPPFESDKDTYITVLSGSKLYIVPFSRSILGEYTGTAHIKIGGNADVTVLHGSAAYPDGIILGDVEVEISGSAHIANFYGCTQNTTENSFKLTWISGSIDLFEWVCSYTSSKTITYTNGTSLYASSTVKGNDNFAAIAANFDKVGDTADAPVTDAPPVTTAAVVTTTAAPAATTKAPETKPVTTAVSTTKAPSVTVKPSAETTKAPETAPAPAESKTLSPVIIIAVCGVGVIAAAAIIFFAMKKKKAK